MTNNDRESLLHLLEKLQNAQAELRIVADRCDSFDLEYANNKLLAAIHALKESIREK